MKAYRVHDGEPEEWCLLVFAETPGRAKALTYDNWFPEWNDIRAERRPAYDGIFVKSVVVETNDDLPIDAPRFYEPSINTEGRY